jgi:hypothetical protein
VARILHCTQKPEDWKSYLADKEKHWRTGYSAKSLANCWESADGFPPEVALAFHDAADPVFQNLEPVLAIPEFKVALLGGGRPSQNDIFVLARSPCGVVCIMVEGKVHESFGPTLDAWRIGASLGKKHRLKFLVRVLGLQVQPNGSIRYQLLHRAASALLEAKRFHAVAAVMLFHSFTSHQVVGPTSKLSQIYSGSVFQ